MMKVRQLLLSFQASIRKTTLAGLALMLLMTLAACSQNPGVSTANRQADSELLDLDSLAAFSDTFNDGAGRTRLMLLLSPT